MMYNTNQKKITLYNRHYILLLILFITSLTGCFKDYKNDFLFKDFQVEFDISSRESNAPGKTYPILPAVEKGSGIQTFQVNLIGGQKTVDQVLNFRVVENESTAIAGLHYNLGNNGTFTIAANSSTGMITVDILDFPATAGTADLVLELVGNQEIKAAENYKKLGLTISLTGPPTQSSPMHTQLGSSNFFNSIAVDLMHPGLSQHFIDQWNIMKANLFAYSNGGRTPYGLQVRFGDDNRLRITLVYTTTASLAFSYAYASWIYKFEPDAGGVGRLEFIEGTDINATNLYGGVMTPLLADYFEKYEFKADWVPAGISTPRQGAMIGGFFRTDDPASFVFGELNYIPFDSNTPRPMPTSPAIYDLFDNNGSRFSSVLINPDDPAQSQDFRDRWNTAKATIQAKAGNREILQLLMVFDEMFNDVIIVTAYTNPAKSKLLGRNRFWLRMSHNSEMELDYIHRDANAGVTTGVEVFDDYLNIEKFNVTRNGDNLVFTSKSDPSSFFIGSLGNLPAATSSFIWPF